MEIDEKHKEFLTPEDVLSIGKSYKEHERMALLKAFKSGASRVSPVFKFNGPNDACDLCNKPLAYSALYVQAFTPIGVLRGHLECCEDLEQ